MSRPRVLVLSDVFPPRTGGSGRWLWELYRRLPDFDVAVLAGAAPGDAEFDQTSPFRIDRIRATFSSWGVSAARAYATTVRQTARIVRTFHPAAVHCGKCLPEGLVGLLTRRLTGTPYWCYAHGEELTLALTSRELRWLTSIVLRNATRVVANSVHTRTLLLDRWACSPERVTVLTPGVDTTRFVPAARDPEVLANLGWTGRRVILTVGALQKRKGQDMLIRALPEIRARCPDVLYAVAGEGWERDDLQALASQLGVADVVRFLGVPNEGRLVQLYQQCDLFALPNRQVGWDFEGFGIVLLEAQACGKPVIAGSSGGTAETILDGETGELVSCDEPGPLEAACVALLEDPARRMRFGTRGREWVVGQFDWPVLCARAAAMFRDPSAASSNHP